MSYKKQISKAQYTLRKKQEIEQKTSQQDDIIRLCKQQKQDLQTCRKLFENCVIPTTLPLECIIEKQTAVVFFLLKEQKPPCLPNVYRFLTKFLERFQENQPSNTSSAPAEVVNICVYRPILLKFQLHVIVSLKRIVICILMQY